MLNITISQFIRNHKNKKNQILFHALKSNGIKETKNLINNFLNEKNSFIFESVEKGKIKGDTLFLAETLIIYGNLTEIFVNK